MSVWLTCEGAPRDLGFDQGEAWRAEIRGVLRRSFGVSGWRAFLARALDFQSRVPRVSVWRRVRRDTLRHYPQLSERTQALARAARISERALWWVLTQELAPLETDGMRCGGGVAFAVTAERTQSGGPLLAKNFDAPRAVAMPLGLRHSRPENAYASLDVVLPVLAGALAGVNERGLAATVTSIPGNGRTAESCTAPAILLVQDVLQRFDCVDGALEWCRARPNAGRASLLFADAQGNVAAAHLSRGRCRVERPRSGAVFGMCRAQTAADLEKALRGSEERPDLGRCRAIQRSHRFDGRTDEDSICRHGEQRACIGSALIDPRLRRVEVVSGAPCNTAAAESQVAVF